jgi:hypothetical protein
MDGQARLNNIPIRTYLAYFDTTRKHRIRHLQQFFVAARVCLLRRCLATAGRHTDRPIKSPLNPHGQERYASNNSIHLREFDGAVTVYQAVA